MQEAARLDCRVEKEAECSRRSALGRTRRIWVNIEDEVLRRGRIVVWFGSERYGWRGSRFCENVLSVGFVGARLTSSMQ
jgi:hypothetical protein